MDDVDFEIKKAQALSLGKKSPDGLKDTALGALVELSAGEDDAWMGPAASLASLAIMAREKRDAMRRTLDRQRHLLLEESGETRQPDARRPA